MARTEKGSRIRLLPPKVQLQEQDALTGSYPTVVRFSTDGRTGNYPIKFNDISTIVFRTSDVYQPGIGLPVGNYWLTDPASSDVSSSTGLSTIITTGSVRPGIVDGLPFVHFVSGVAVPPFNDTGQLASDMKSYAYASSIYPYFATGSTVATVGEGFTSPLWSKEKIVIDISVIAPTSLSLASGALGTSGSSYPMAYYNFETKIWEPIGRGHVINAFSNGADTIDNLMVGFIGGFMPTGASFFRINSMGFMVSDFGFPYHPKFHATSSQTVAMSRYITQPFVLEKAVVEVSGTWEVGGINLSAYNTGQTVTSSVNTLFLLNQRKNQNFSYVKAIPNEGVGGAATIMLTASVPTTRQLSLNAAPTKVNTIRDIMGFSNVYSFAKEAYTKTITGAGSTTSTPSAELNLTSDDTLLNINSISTVSGANWSQKIETRLALNTPAATSRPITDVLIRFGSASNYDDLVVGCDGYRTGLGMAQVSTRGLINDFFNTSIRRTVAFGSTNLTIPRQKNKTNPYILMPDDEIILGWQLPISSNPGQLIIPNQYESRFTFGTGSYKLTLYGSYVKEGKEENETLNQLLSSNSIHEALGED